MIEAVIFDMDGLLIDSEPFWRKAQKLAFETVSVALSEADLKSTMGIRIDEVVEHWYSKKPWEGTSQKDIEALIVDKVIEQVREEGITRPGVVSTLDFFKHKQIPMAVASSSSMEIIEAAINTLGINDYFVELFSAEHETYGKPNPAVFIKTAFHLGVQPQKCLVFEDSPSGVLAAKSAKMKCVVVPEPELKKNKFINTADIILDSLENFDENKYNQLNL